MDILWLHHDRSRQRTITLVLVSVIICLILVLLHVTTFRYVVKSSSMLPTLTINDWIIVRRSTSSGYLPERGDIVAFRLAANEKNVYLKRVVGLPGEVVELRAGRVYIDGIEMPEYDVVYSCYPAMSSDRIWQLGQDGIFVLGDNCLESTDSRQFGAIGQDAVIGKAVFRYWPIIRIGSLEED